MAQTDEATQLYEQAIDAYRAGEYEEALGVLAQARELFVEVDNPTGEVEALGSMGVIYVELEEWDQAQRRLDEALALCVERQDRGNQAKVLGNLGALYERQGHVEKAAVAYEQAITLFRELDEPAYEKDVARKLSKLKLKRGKFVEALGAYPVEPAGEEAAGGAQKIVGKLFRLLGGIMGGGSPDESDADAEAEEDVLDVPPDVGAGSSRPT